MQIILVQEAHRQLQGVHSTENLKKHNSKAPNVCWKRLVRGLQVHFRGSERKRATGAFAPVRGCSNKCKIKISELELDVFKVLLDTDILRLDVTVHTMTCGV